MSCLAACVYNETKKKVKQNITLKTNSHDKIKYIKFIENRDKKNSKTLNTL